LKSHFFYNIIKFLWRGLLSLLIVFVLASLALLIPQVQTRIVKVTAKKLSKELKHEVSLERVSLTLQGNVDISGVKVKDERDSCLLDIQHLVLNFSYSELIIDRKITIDNATLNKAFLLIRKDEDHSNLSKFTAAISRLFPKDTTKSDTAASITIVRSITLQNSTFGISSGNKIKPEQFEGSNFLLQNINADITRFYIHNDTIEAEINNAKAFDQYSPLDVKELSVFFRKTASSLEFHELEAKWNDSYLKEQKQFVLRYKTLADFSDFIQKVRIKANLTKSILHTKDIAIFASSLKKYDDIWKVDLRFTGFIKRFTAKDMQIAFGKQSVLHGELSADGLPTILETFTELDLQKSNIAIEDLKQYIPDNAYQRVKKFEYFKLSSKFIGFPSDFVAYGDFVTALGAFKSDVKLNPSIEGITEYQGKLSAKDFKLGQFLELETIGQTSFEGNVVGKGFNINDLQINTESAFEYIELYNYRYHNIDSKLTLKNSFISGSVSIEDDNLFGQLHGTLDMTDSINIVKINTDLKHANLKQLQLIEDSTRVEGIMSIDLKGPNLLRKLDIDHFTGNITTKCVDIYYKNKDFDLDNTQIIAKKLGKGQRLLSLNSNYISTKIEGDFVLSTLPQDMFSFFEEYMLNIENDKNKIAAYYQTHTIDSTDYGYHHKLKYNLNIKKPNPILKLLMPSLSISEGSTFSGEYTNGLEPEITLDGKIKEIALGERKLKKNRLYFIATKLAEETQILSQFGFSSATQIIGENLSTEKLSVNGSWEKNLITFTSFMKQANSNNHLSLNGDIKLLEDTIRFHVDTSELEIQNEYWRFKPENAISFVGKDIIFDKISLYNIDQSIFIDGTLSEKEDKELYLNVKGFKIQNLDRFIGKELKGQVSGKVTLSDIYQKKIINSRLTAKDLFYNGTYVGFSSLMFNNIKDPNTLKLNINHFLEGIKAFHVKGDIDNVFGEERTLDLTLTLDDFNAKIAEPFIYENVNNITGLLNGELQITGTDTEPHLSGNVLIKDMSCHVVYLNTDYTFHNAKLYFKKDNAYFKNVIIKDHLEKKGVLNGHISFEEGIYTDISFYFKKFNLLNKEVAPEDDAAFYGSFYGSGDIHVKGFTDDITIYSKELKTEKRTKLFIPLQGYETAENKNYIRFISRKDVGEEASIGSEIDLSGVKLDLNLEVTDQAYAEIIFDKSAGDIIKSYGEGLMKIQLDTRGDFNLYGDYVITDGTYNFTLLNIINKEFVIEPNSSITWTGNPYEGMMNIIAKYSQSASLSPILDTALVDVNTSEARRKYPVSVEMELTEQLLSPELDFDIVITDYPSSLPGNNNNFVTTEEFINEFYATINANEQELNRQVFSLILLKRLGSLNSNATGGVGGGATGSMSEFLGNYLSHVLSQVNENLEVDLDLTDFNNSAEDNLTFRLSYSFLDGRFRVTRSSTFINDKNSSNTTNNNTNELVGDWTLEYSVTPDGKLRLKAFNKSESDIGIVSQGNSVNMTYGASLLHTQSFNKLSDLFKKKNKKKKEK